jgi:hypothetical protein
MSKNKERLQLLGAVDELCVPAFIGSDEMGDGVDDIDTLFDSYFSISELGYCFGVPVCMFESLAIFFGFLNVARYKIR